MTSSEMGHRVRFSQKLMGHRVRFSQKLIGHPSVMGTSDGTSSEIHTEIDGTSS